MARRHKASTIRKISLAQTGKRNSMYGRRHKKSSRVKMSEVACGKNNPMYGKHHGPDVRKRISAALRKAWLKRKAARA